MNMVEDAIHQLSSFLIVAMMICVPLAVMINPVHADGSGDYPAPDNGDWIITQETVVSNEIIRMNGNIFVKNGGSLHLENVTLIFNSNSNGQYRLDVENGGVLYMYNSTTDRGTDYSYGFRVLDGGKLRMENSVMKRCGYNAWHYYGLTLYGDDVVVKNNVFMDGYMGIYAYVATGHVYQGNTFRNNTHVALYLRSISNADVSGNIMEDNNYGMYLYVIDNSTVENNHAYNNTAKATNHGLEVLYSDSIIFRNNVANETNFGIYFYGCTNSEISDNNAYDNHVGIAVQVSDGITVASNTMMYNNYGMYITTSNTDLVIRDNNVSFSRDYNMYLYRTTDSMIENNELRNTTASHGLAIRECSNLEVSFNSISGILQYALWVWDSDNITLEGNEVLNSHLGYYILRSEDNVFSEGELRYNNYGIYVAGSTRNLIVNSSSVGSNNFDLHVRDASTELTLLNTEASDINFHDTESVMEMRNYLEIEMMGRTGPIEGVDVEVMETLTGEIIYATEYFGGSDRKTDEGGIVSWIRALHTINNQNGTEFNNVRIRINDHGVYESEKYESMDSSHTVRFNKNALTVDQGGNGDYVTIQEAVDAADDGDTILVASGTYQENVDLHKPLYIFGKGGEVKLDASGGTGIIIRQASTLGNLSLVNATKDLDIMGNTMVYNVTFATTEFHDDYYLAVGYYLTINTVLDDLQPVSDVNVTIENGFFPTSQYYSDPNGRVRNIPLVDYADNASYHWELNPYTINGNLKFRSGIHELTMHSNTEINLFMTRHGNFGAAVACGDINDDGFEDYIIGAPLDDEGGVDAGAVYIFYGPHDGEVTLRPIDADVVLLGERIQSRFGSTLEVGDFNGDGVTDLVIGSPTFNSTDTHGLNGSYYSGDDFSDFRYFRIDENIDYDWGNGNPPGLWGDFSIEWSGYLSIEVEDDYMFYFDHDDGVRLYIDDQRVLDAWSYTGDEAYTPEPVHLTAGSHELFIRFFDSGGQAELVFKWETPTMSKQVVPARNLFYLEDIEPGNGAVYVYSGEKFLRGDVKTSDGSRMDWAYPGFGKTLSVGDVNQDGMDDIFAGFHDGTRIMYGNFMIYHETYDSEPMLSTEWDPVISGDGGVMTLTGDGKLNINCEESGDSYAYTMSRETFNQGLVVNIQVERSDATVRFLEGMDYKVPEEDVELSEKQEDHMLFSLRSNGDIRYWPVFNGSVENADPDNLGEIISFTISVNADYSYMNIWVDGQLLVNTPLEGWDPIYLKLGDSNTWGDRRTNITTLTPYLTTQDILGWENATYLNNTQQTIAASMKGDTFLFTPEMDSYYTYSVVSMEQFTGDHNYTRYAGGLTLSPYFYVDIVPNGDFDDDWTNWTQTETYRDKNDATYAITTEENGDWLVYDGKTAGIGPDRDEVAHQNNQGRNNDGQLVSDPFVIPEDIEMIDFWHHVEWWSFERASESGYQDEYDDLIIYRIVLDATNETIAELLYGKDHGGGDGENEGHYQFDVSEYEGQTIRFEVEMSENRPQSEDGIAQVDSIMGAKESDDVKGDFTSEFIDLNRTFLSFIPSWTMEEHGGEIRVYYRVNESDDWEELDGNIVEFGQPESGFQYRVEMDGVKDNPYPIVRYLHFSFFNNTPVYIQAGNPVDTGNIREEHTLGVVDDTMITLYDGSHPIMNITADGEILAVTSPGDVDNNDVPDIYITTDGNAYLFLMNGMSDKHVSEADYTFSGVAGYGQAMEGGLVGSPLELDGDGRVHVLPSYLDNLALTTLNFQDGSLIYPDTDRTVRPTIKNTGLARLEDITVTLTITADSYNYQDTMQVSLDPDEEVELQYAWHVPADEGVEYTIQISLEDDMNAQDNLQVVKVTSRYHSIELSTQTDYDAVLENGTAHYHVLLTNTGTLGTDDVTFDVDLPDDWYWWISKNDVNITTLSVDTVMSLELYVMANSSLGIYPITLTAISENGTTDADLALFTHVVNRDLTPLEVKFLREDGKEGTPISGEDTRVVLTIMNFGVQASDEFNTSLYIDDVMVEEKTLSAIPANSTAELTFTIVLTEGDHDFRFVVDEQDVIREHDEFNNELTASVSVKPDISAVPYTIKVRVLDLDMQNMSDIKVKVSSGSSIFENVTNENGISWIVVDSYPEGEIYLVEAYGAELYAARTVSLYSEDVEVSIELVLGRYSFSVDAPVRDKDILPGETVQFMINLTNTGDFSDNFTVAIKGVPEDWFANITGDGLEDGILFLDKDGETSLTLEVDSWQYAPAYHRYEITVEVASIVSPLSRKDINTRSTILPVENITLSTDEPVTTGFPSNNVYHRIIIKNEGNTIRNITMMLSGDIQYASLDDTDFTLEPGEDDDFWLTINVPNLRAGTELDHELMGIVIGVGVTNSIDFITEIEPDNDISVSISGESLVVKNYGNVLEHLSFILENENVNLTLQSSEIDIDMGETISIPMDVEMLYMDIEAGRRLTIDVSFFNGDSWYYAKPNLYVPEVLDIALIPDSESIMALPGTMAEYTILVRNQGNSDVDVFFSAVNDGDEPLMLTSTVFLPLGQETEITLNVLIPEDAMGQRTITFSATAGDLTREIDLQLDLEATRNIQLDLLSQRGYNGGVRYNIKVYNTGDLPELVDFHTNCGMLDLVQVEIEAGGDLSLHLFVAPGTVCPGTIFVNGTADEALGIMDSLELDPPPVAGIHILSSLPATTLEPVVFKATVQGDNTYDWFIDDVNWQGDEISYPFSTSGTYVITLIVTDARDTGVNPRITSTTTMEIEISNQLPIIKSALYITGDIDDYVGFDGTECSDPDGTIVDYSWTVDTSTYHGPHVYHQFTESGVYNVTLTVTDNHGATNSSVIQVTIKEDTTDIIPEVENEELNMGLVGFSAILLLVLIGIIVFMFFRLDQEEGSLLMKLDDVEKKVTFIDDKRPSGPAQAAPGPMNTCPDCGAGVPTKFKFCNKCGSAMVGKQGSPAQDGIRVCPDCGAGVPIKFKFCNKCGTTMPEQEVKE